MGNASLSRFAINRKVQSDKDTINVDDLMYHPHAYGGGFTISTEVDNYGDLVEPRFEASKTKILSAVSAGQVVMPGTTDALALLLASGLGSITSTLLSTPETFEDADVNPATNVITIADHPFLTGDPVRLSNAGGALPVGIVGGTEYFVRKTGASTLTLHQTLSGARANTGTVDIDTAAGGGTHSIFISAYQHVITTSSNAAPNYHTVLYHDGTTDCRILGCVLSGLDFGAGFDAKRLNMSAEFLGLERETNDTAYPAKQVDLNPIHFTLGGATLSITVDGEAIAAYDENNWGGFTYQMQNIVDAEHRAGSSALRIIEVIDKAQSLALVLDYKDDTFKNVIQEYQSKTSPPKFGVEFSLNGNNIDVSGTFKEKLQMEFFNAILGDHGYSQTPEIGKQMLPFEINFDEDSGKSSEITIVNRIPTYLS